MVRPWSGRAAVEALDWVRRVGRAHSLPCCLCGEPIDYDLRAPDGMSCSVEHVKPRKTHPELTWDRRNWAPAHLVCNQGGGGRLVADLRRPGIGLSMC